MGISDLYSTFPLKWLVSNEPVKERQKAQVQSLLGDLDYCCCSVMSDSFWPHGLQHVRLPCPSPSPGVCSNSCPSTQRYNPTISSLLSPSPPVFNLSQHQGLFQWVSSSHQVAKVSVLQFQHQSFQWIFRPDFLQVWLVWSLCNPRDSQEYSLTPQFKSISSSALSFFSFFFFFFQLSL